MRKTKIIAIGGGSVYVPCQPATTLAIDEEAVRLAAAELPIGRSTVNILFIPTASRDDIDYCHSIYTHFGLRLGCNYDHLRLIADMNTRQNIEDKIAWADIIYVGGGNTRYMMREWDKRGVSDLLRVAYAEGKVLMGLSAGSICWFGAGLSDSNKFDAGSGEDWEPMWVTGLGLVPLLHSPHFDSEAWRRRELAYNMAEGRLSKPVLALEDNCAIEVVGNEYRILISRPWRRAYLYRNGNRLRLHPTSNFQPLESLMT
ncbi:MAG: peptidase E [Candidatus Yanofskybacteria bacterium]|nr:peptidase E [Candidatus Yanofskybacteria bacterium]